MILACSGAAENNVLKGVKYGGKDEVDVEPTEIFEEP